MLPLKWSGASNKRMPNRRIKLLKSSASAAFLLLVCATSFARSWQALTEQVPSLTKLPQPVALCKGITGHDRIQVWLPRGQSEPALNTLSQWPAHPLAEFLNCFSLRWYQHYDELSCSRSGERGHQRCQLALLPRDWSQRQLVFIADTSESQTIGSASPWQMVLPVTASIDVLGHEIGHWLGFADEYAMSASLAEDYCQGRYRHPSVNVVTTTQQRVSSRELKALWQRLPWREAVADWRDLAQLEDDGQWRLGSAASKTVGLFPSPTCNAITDVYSWKPVPQMTAMEYHDVTIWPEVYLELLRSSQGQ